MSLILPSIISWPSLRHFTCAPRKTHPTGDRRSVTFFPRSSPHPPVSPITPQGAHNTPLLLDPVSVHGAWPPLRLVLWVPPEAWGALSSVEFSNYHSQPVPWAEVGVSVLTELYLSPWVSLLCPDVNRFLG